MKLTILFVFLASLCNAQQYLKVNNDQGTIFCGVSSVDFKIKKKTMALSTEYGNLNLEIVKKGKNSPDICEDEQGYLYSVVVITNQTGGVGVMFLPDSTYRMTFTIANQPLCEPKEGDISLD